MKVCINQDHFNKIIGYGLVGLLTLGLIVLIIASIIDESNLKPLIIGKHIWGFCTNTILSGMEMCVISSNDQPSLCPCDFWIISYGSKILLILDIIGLSIWFYFKQEKLRFGFCESTYISKQPSTEARR